MGKQQSLYQIENCISTCKNNEVGLLPRPYTNSKAIKNLNVKAKTIKPRRKHRGKTS